MKLTKMELFAIASVVHAANKAWCKANGDYSQEDFEYAPDWQRESAISGVKFHAENEYTTPADSHRNWRELKEKEGWVYGEKKDPKAKTHPCMVPFEDLPPEQQAKNYIFHAIVHSLVWSSPVFSATGRY